MLYQTPLLANLYQLDPFIEPDTEISKSEIIHLAAGQVSYFLFTMLKLLIFHRIGKDREGNIYLL